MVDLTPIVNAVITLAAALITAFLIPWIKKKYSAEKLAELQKWTKIAVEAAEMIYKGSGLGDLKKSYVQNYLAEKGYSINVIEVDALIESAVKEMKDNEPYVLPVSEGTDVDA